MESIGFTWFTWFHKFSHFRTFYTEKTSLERKKYRQSRGIAVSFWTKFEAVFSARKLKLWLQASFEPTWCRGKWGHVEHGAKRNILLFLHETSS
jgi:hypothetical protein